jgi:hypothetical protein
MAVADAASLRLLAREVAHLLGRAEPERLLTAQEVAVRFNVDRSWVYAHADELGVIRLGTGPRPRLRFDAAVVAQMLLPATPTHSSSPPRGATSVPLLPIRSARSTRSLDS